MESFDIAHCNELSVSDAKEYIKNTFTLFQLVFMSKLNMTLRINQYMRSRRQK